MNLPRVRLPGTLPTQSPPCGSISLSLSTRLVSLAGQHSGGDLEKHADAFASRLMSERIARAGAGFATTYAELLERCRAERHRTRPPRANKHG